ncbi:hypothetical protein [Actinacidiphila sp. ITFR-21]|uniref:hypothetical protein n=1 Tax=Actinacidiphila sp. ITFR-21 TaxID=3075199 RepID=UPI00288A9B39|nr:hypothetical protein [Streptomyces sp. ITFR-21]WNI14850.1 hypothetical protein RLT57_04400 [Streptomyces sp. ITFR-21]
MAASAGWPGWLFTDVRPRGTAGCLLATAVAGGMLAAVFPGSPAIALTAVAALRAGTALRIEMSLAVVVAGAVALAVALLAVGGSTTALLGYTVLIGGGLTAGLVRRRNVQRAEQAERLLEQTARARQAGARAAALAEGTRIARGIRGSATGRAGGKGADRAAMVRRCGRERAGSRRSVARTPPTAGR